MLYCKAPGAVLPLNNRRISSPSPDLRNPKVRMMVAAGIFVLCVIAVAIGVSYSHRTEADSLSLLQSQALARLAMTNFSLASLTNGSLPLAAGSVNASVLRLLGAMLGRGPEVQSWGAWKVRETKSPPEPVLQRASGAAKSGVASETA